MSSLEKDLYKNIVVKPNVKADYGVGSKIYKGFSTVDVERPGFQLIDMHVDDKQFTIVVELAEAIRDPGLTCSDRFNFSPS